MGRSSAAVHSELGEEIERGECSQCPDWGREERMPDIIIMS